MREYRVWVQTRIYDEDGDLLSSNEFQEAGPPSSHLADDVTTDAEDWITDELERLHELNKQDVFGSFVSSFSRALHSVFSDVHVVDATFENGVKFEINAPSGFTFRGTVDLY